MCSLILLNAVYFKGIWAEKFDAKDTKKLPFYVSKNSQKEVRYRYIRLRYHRVYIVYCILQIFNILK